MALSGEIINFFGENFTNQANRGRKIRDISKMQMKLVLVGCACVVALITMMLCSGHTLRFFDSPSPSRC